MRFACLSPLLVLLRHLLEQFLIFSQEELSLALSLAQLEEDLSDPLSLINGLSDEELDELLRDVESYADTEQKSNGCYLTFWTSYQHVLNAEKRYRSRTETTLHKSVTTEVHKLFSQKNSQELLELKNDIHRSIREGRRSDVEYWELMEKEVGVEYSRAIIREVYQDLLSKQIDALTKLREIALKRSSEREEEEVGGGGDENGRGIKRPREGVDYRFVQNTVAKGVIQSVDRPSDDLPPGAALSSNPTPLDSLEPFSNVTASSKFTYLGDEEEFEEMEELMQRRDEISLPGSTYWWQDKYRPRKPRYFNRVKTGYDWNKYNSTHYDHDNPPPKTIQGYKFTVFYPDLIDVTDTPKYFLEAAEENEFAIIRFHAGPPYEDIAFKILNQQWDIGRKAGFKCVFQRGVLQLHFNFKRHRYKS
jgi:hypothetical protein